MSNLAQQAQLAASVPTSTDKNAATLDDRYTATTGRVFLTGTQAL